MFIVPKKICQLGSQCLTNYCFKQSEGRVENLQEEVKQDRHGSNPQTTTVIGYKQGNQSTVIIEEENCAVCLNKIEDYEVTEKIKCGHKFHPPCIHTWLSIKTRCPICRKVIRED
ncbi:unnamed protein product [Moneuplotes crassus]|uniref:RING-type domain-containing protein n=1 Tax=Euplotes crassus TaxID=5936 RepID=A0AAD1X9E4_EUPCR|nr:unnamed protein product [Moneuplotes crassus]